MKNSNSNSNPAASPCINVCAIDGDGVCLGCFRTLDEIAAYSSLPREGRIAVNETARQRQAEQQRRADRGSDFV